MIQRWLNFVLDLIVAALATLLMTFATQLRDKTSAAAFGVSIVSVLGFSQNMSQFIFFYTDLETFLGAIARIKEYVEGIRPEDSEKDADADVPDGWPSNGAVDFKRVTAAYRLVQYYHSMSLV